MKRKLKLKPPVIRLLQILGIVIVLLVAFFLLVGNEKNTLRKLGYSEKAIEQILLKWQANKVKEIGKNKTVNAAFESDDYQQKNLEIYQKITYQNQKDLIKNINTLIKKKYKPNEISLILAHGNNEDVTAFAKREKVKYLEQFFSVPYAKLKNYDRYVTYYDQEREDAETTVLHVNLDLDKEDYTDYIEIEHPSDTVLVNKHRMLTEEYVPKNLKTVKEEYLKVPSEKIELEQKTLAAFIVMKEAAEKDGRYILVNSGYRSYQDQVEIQQEYLEYYGQNYVDNYVSKPGFSEHQTGLSIDVASKDTAVFVESDEYDWMMENAYLYGFILRYPKSKEEITGYKCEAWHYRYVGKEIAKYIHENNITYDEYYMQFLDED